MENVAVTSTQLPKKSQPVQTMRDGFMVSTGQHPSESPFSPPPPPGMQGYGSRQQVPMEGYNRPTGGGGGGPQSPRYAAHTPVIKSQGHSYAYDLQQGYASSPDAFGGGGGGGGRRVRIEEAVAESMDRDEELKRQGAVERSLLERDLQEKVTHYNELFIESGSQSENYLSMNANCCDIDVNYVVLCCVVLFCFVLFCFVLFCFVLFCFVLFCFVLFCFVLFCVVLYRCGSSKKGEKEKRSQEKGATTPPPPHHHHHYHHTLHHHHHTLHHTIITTAHIRPLFIRPATGLD
jgi:hypothetical protein